MPIWLIWLNFGWYCVLFAVYGVWYRSLGLGLYWAGAAVLTLGVIVMAKSSS